MSVLKNERKPSKMEVQSKAYDLASYTIQCAGNEKVVPKHHRWAIGTRLVTIAMDICECIDIANSMNLGLTLEAEERRKMQDFALAKTFALMTAIHTARRLRNFDEDRHKFWIGLVLDVQRLLKAWRDSDTERLKHI